MSGYIDPFEREVEPGDSSEPGDARPPASPQMQDVVAIIDDVEDEDVSAS